MPQRHKTNQNEFNFGDLNENEIRVYIGFSDLSDSEYAAEKKKYCNLSRNSPRQSPSRNSPEKTMKNNSNISPRPMKQSHWHSNIPDIILGKKHDRNKEKQISNKPQDTNANKITMKTKTKEHKNITSQEYQTRLSSSIKKTNNENVNIRPHPPKHPIKEIKRNDTQIAQSFSDKLIQFIKARKYSKQWDIEYIHSNSKKLENAWNDFLEHGVEKVFYSAFQSTSFYNRLKYYLHDFNTYVYQYYLFTTPYPANPSHQNILLAPAAPDFPTVDDLNSDNKSCFIVQSYIKPFDINLFWNIINNKVDNKDRLNRPSNTDVQTPPLSNTQKTQEEITILSFLNHPDEITALSKWIPQPHFIYSEGNLLNYSPIKITGITLPALIRIGKTQHLEQCFDLELVHYRRYLCNLGPGNIIHYVMKYSLVKGKHSIDYSISTHRYGEPYDYYYFLQKPGDIVIIEPGNIHEGYIESASTNIITWSVMNANRNDIWSIINIEKALNEPMDYNIRDGNITSTVPIKTMLLNYWSKNICTLTLDKEALKIWFVEWTSMIASDDTDKQEHFLTLNKISVAQQPKREGINIIWCGYCYKEVFNYWSYSKWGKLKVCCLNCYLTRYENGDWKRIILYKYRQDQLRVIYGKLRTWISAKEGEQCELGNYRNELENYNVYGVNVLDRSVVDLYCDNIISEMEILWNTRETLLNTTKTQEILFKEFYGDYIEDNKGVGWWCYQKKDGRFSPKTEREECDNTKTTGREKKSNSKLNTQITSKCKLNELIIKRTPELKQENPWNNDYETKVNKGSLLSYLYERKNKK